MLEYDRIEVFKGIDVNKTHGLHQCINWQYFLKINSRFQPEVCYGCHDLMQKAMNFNDVAIVAVKYFIGYLYDDCKIKP